MTMRTVVGMIGARVVVCPGDERSVRPRIPAGTPLEIVWFDTMYMGRLSAFGSEPGRYLNKAYPILSVDGREVAVNEAYLEPALGFSRRPYDPAAFRLGDLPETAFWEDDLVSNDRVGLVRVRTVDYENIGRVRADGATPMPVYTCDVPRGGSMAFEEGHLTLHRRGNVWRHHNGMETHFATLDGAARFHVAIGNREALKNGDTFAFTAEEALEELEAGRADCAYDGIDVFDRARDSYQLVKLGDEAVGDACRACAIEKLELAIAARVRHGL